MSEWYKWRKKGDKIIIVMCAVMGLCAIAFGLLLYFGAGDSKSVLSFFKIGAAFIVIAILGKFLSRIVD